MVTCCSWSGTYITPINPPVHVLQTNKKNSPPLNQVTYFFLPYKTNKSTKVINLTNPLILLHYTNQLKIQLPPNPASLRSWLLPWIASNMWFAYALMKNPAYGRHRISRPMRIVGPIQFWKVCVIYLEDFFFFLIGQLMRPRIHASTRPHDGSTRGQWTLCTHPPFLGLHACNKMGSTRVIRWAPHQFFHAK